MRMVKTIMAAGKEPEETAVMTDDDMLGLLIRVDERTKTLVEDVGQLKHVLLEGNGTPAVTVQLATLNTEMATVKEHIRDYRIPRNVWMGILVSAILGFGGIAIELASKF